MPVFNFCGQETLMHSEALRVNVVWDDVYTDPVQQKGIQALTFAELKPALSAGVLDPTLRSRLDEKVCPVTVHAMLTNVFQHTLGWFEGTELEGPSAVPVSTFVREVVQRTLDPLPDVPVMQLLEEHYPRTLADCTMLYLFASDEELTRQVVARMGTRIAALHQAYWRMVVEPDTLPRPAKRQRATDPAPRFQPGRMISGTIGQADLTALVRLVRRREADEDVAGLLCDLPRSRADLGSVDGLRARVAGVCRVSVFLRIVGGNARCNLDPFLEELREAKVTAASLGRPAVCSLKLATQGDDRVLAFLRGE